MNFKNDFYINIITDLIHDIFYSNISSRGRISSIRQYTEILIRKVLDLEKDEFVTVGHKNLKDKLISQSNNNELIISALNTIQELGNRYTHTQYTEIVSDAVQEDAFDALLDVSAYIFVNYFSHYKFGSNSNIMSNFSLLPPVLRYKVLNNLYKKDSTNTNIQDKLCLAIFKNEGEAKAYEWLKDQKQTLENSPAYKGTMYDKCLEKIDMLSRNNSGYIPIYKTFEEAISYFRAVGKIDSQEPEIVEFNSIMELLYIGRQESK
ncbi:hypothetical protein [Lactococcus petauri]|uniref:hypothetical protein n=1 Tax=Lactococcus petauri TaxID=1940789 RepID=UPI0038555F7E